MLKEKQEKKEKKKRNKNYPMLQLDKV